MTYIEYSRIGSYGLMFVVDAAIADRHIVAGEFGHFCAERLMQMRERSTLHEWVLSGKFMVSRWNSNRKSREPAKLVRGSPQSKVLRQTTEDCVPTSTNECISFKMG
jgi:hypothetical protein